MINIDVNTDNGVDKDYPIVGFRAVYFWDTTPDHGFLFQGNSLRQIRGFVFDLDYLPTEVSASLAGGVGPYLGEGPKVIQLVHDPSDPAT